MTPTDTGCTVRPAHIDDLPRLTEIYNQYVTATAATFDMDPFTVDQRSVWFRRYATTGRHRLLVAERGGTVIAYASTSPFHERRAYETTVEMTVLSAPECIGQRLGQRLYESLLPAIEGEDIRLAIAAITLPNDASCALHERFGFTRAAVLPEVGRKFGRYWDVVWYARPSSGSGLNRESGS
jgi:phosphinothricin acetyltransferase